MTKLFNNYVSGDTSQYAVVKSTSRSIADDWMFQLSPDSRLEKYIQGSGMEGSATFSFGGITETTNVKLVDKSPSIWKTPVNINDVLNDI